MGLNKSIVEAALVSEVKNVSKPEFAIRCREN